MYTVKDIADFCHTHKGRRAFRNHSYNEIANDVYNAIQNNEMVYVEDDLGICGVCLYVPHFHSRIIYIKQIVCRSGSRGFATLVLEARKRFPGWAIQGSRDGKIVTFRHLWATTHQVATARHVA
jgi:hypothetical protein